MPCGTKLNSNENAKSNLTFTPDNLDYISIYKFLNLNVFQRAFNSQRSIDNYNKLVQILQIWPSFLTKKYLNVKLQEFFSQEVNNRRDFNNVLFSSESEHLLSGSSKFSGIIEAKRMNH